VRYSPWRIVTNSFCVSFLCSHLLKKRLLTFSSYSIYLYVKFPFCQSIVLQIHCGLFVLKGPEVQKAATQFFTLRCGLIQRKLRSWYVRLGVCPYVSPTAAGQAATKPASLCSCVCLCLLFNVSLSSDKNPLPV